MRLNTPPSKLCLALAAAFALHAPAHADDAPKVSNVLKKMLSTLPLEKDREKLQSMVGALKKTQCGGGLSGCYMTQSGPIHLYFFTSGTAQQTFLIVDDQTIDMPKILGGKVQSAFGKSKLGSPIFSISTTDYDLQVASMPPALQKVIHDHYFNVSDLSFSSGVQLAASIQLDGGIKHAMKTFGADIPGMIIRAAAVLPIPTDLASGAGTGAGLAEDITHGATMTSAAGKALLPEAFVEFQFAPGTRLPVPEPAINLTDATFFLNNELVFGYKGNAQFAGDDKNLLIQFQTPLTPEGLVSFTNFSFRLATPPSFTMFDGAIMMFDMAVPDARLAQYGGGFISGIAGNKQALHDAANTISVFALRNPVPPPTYRFGDPKYPWPNDPKYFNVALISPLAPGGPLMSLGAGLTLLGVDMGQFSSRVDANGLTASAMSDVTLRLGPLGHVKVSNMVATANINAKRQDISLKGKFSDQPIDIEMSGNTLTADVPATCSNPFRIHFTDQISAGLNLSNEFEGQGGIAVDPATITGCVGDALAQAYNKIGNQYGQMQGYTQDAARAAYNRVGRGADAAYQNAKNGARNAADASRSALTNAFKSADNAFKHIGKKHHHSGPDPKFASSVFDWDYYYDAYPDLQAPGVDLTGHWHDTGFYEGRQGSAVFNVNYYLWRYLDVQQQCGADKDCALNHWVNTGYWQGRQGSQDFNVVSYQNRNPNTAGPVGWGNWDGLFQDYLTSGIDAGRIGTPNNDVSTGPVEGPVDAGGGGGDPWDDGPGCNNQPITGWNAWYGGRLDGLQVGYGNNGHTGNFLPAHGYANGSPKANVQLPGDEWVVRVDYRSSSMMDAVTFITNHGRVFGPYGGGGGSPNTYNATPGQAVGCLSGRAGSSMDHLTFSSTNWR